MTRHACAAPLTLATLAGYWLGELDEAQTGRVDEQLLACGACAAELASLVELAAGIRGAVRAGAVRAIGSAGLLQRLAAGGLRLREYRISCNGSVHCTVAPDDDVMVARLQVPLADVERLDAVLVDGEGRQTERLRDLPFDRAAGEIVLLPPIEPIRALGPATSRICLLAVDAAGERQIGEYTFIHRPWQNV